MSRKRFSVAALVAMALAVIATSVAWADPTSSHSGGAFANQTGVVRIDPNDPTVAYVSGRYNCPTGEAHLFVSVKQVAGGSGLAPQGRGQQPADAGRRGMAVPPPRSLHVHLRRHVAHRDLADRFGPLCPW